MNSSTVIDGLLEKRSHKYDSHLERGHMVLLSKVSFSAFELYKLGRDGGGGFQIGDTFYCHFCCISSGGGLDCPRQLDSI